MVKSKRILAYLLVLTMLASMAVMASAGAHSDHVNHVSTQLPYAITAAIVSGIGYLIAGALGYYYGTNVALIAPAAALVLMVLTMMAARKMAEKP